MNNASAYPGPWDWGAQPEPTIKRPYQNRPLVLLWRSPYGIAVLGSYLTPRGVLNAHKAAVTIDYGGDWRVWNVREGWPRGIHRIYLSEM